MTDEKKLTELFRRLNLTSPGWQSIDTFSKIVFQIVIADPKNPPKTLYGGILTSGDIATCFELDTDTEDKLKSLNDKMFSYGKYVLSTVLFIMYARHINIFNMNKDKYIGWWQKTEHGKIFKCLTLIDILLNRKPFLSEYDECTGIFDFSNPESFENFETNMVNIHFLKELNFSKTELGEYFKTVKGRVKKAPLSVEARNNIFCEFGYDLSLNYSDIEWFIAKDRLDDNFISMGDIIGDKLATSLNYSFNIDTVFRLTNLHTVRALSNFFKPDTRKRTKIHNLFKPINKNFKIGLYKNHSLLISMIAGINPTITEDLFVEWVINGTVQVNFERDLKFGLKEYLNEHHPALYEIILMKRKV